MIMPAYRYNLVRDWDKTLPSVTWICLNPSTAGATEDDPTTRRLIGFSKGFGFGSYRLLNLFPMRTKSPAILVKSSMFERIGRLNVRMLPPTDAKIILAWGANAAHPKLRTRRDAMVKALCLLEDESDVEIFTLGLTKHGEPRPPLYLKGSTPLESWTPVRGSL